MNIYNLLNKVSFRKPSSSINYSEQWLEEQIIRNYIKDQLIDNISKLPSNAENFRIFCYYHVHVENIRVDCSEFKNPNKYQGLQKYYLPLLAGSICRLSKLLHQNDRVICFIDRKNMLNLKTILDHHNINTKNIFFILLNIEDGVEPMRIRFLLVKYLWALLYKNFKDIFELYCLDSDLIPSKTLLTASPLMHKSDVVFSTNADSHPLWQINEGVFALNSTRKTELLLSYAEYIYQYLILSDEVKKYWKNPKIWRGAQASLHLTSFKFNDNTCLPDCKKSFFIDEEKRQLLQLTRISGKYINAVPDIHDANSNWKFNSGKTYHFSGNHKRNPKLSDFIQFCLYEKP